VVDNDGYRYVVDVDENDVILAVDESVLPVVVEMVSPIEMIVRPSHHGIIVMMMMMIRALP
jgi:hypothetical protein